MGIGFGLRRYLGLAALVLSAASAASAQSAPAPQSAEPQDESARAASGQPRWTARPLFGETDVYVLPSGATSLLFQLRPTAPTSGATVTDTAYRAEFGLPGRFQLGLHATGRTEGGDSAIGNIDAQTLEMRWALAAWGRLWGNPTMHAEWREASRGADVGTVKLLLGGGNGSGWRWGSNVAWTQEASGAREIARAWTAGVSYESGRFASVGVETRLAFVDRLGTDRHTRSAMARELLAGPSLQIRPVRRLYINLAPLFGATVSSPRSRTTLAASWQF
ncbi:MAG TPA: hypothetical protein VFD69_20400 [Vicinamibacterales bacterium]|nr:hypothetical protein [Vicinamibacterales bacterium]